MSLASRILEQLLAVYGPQRWWPAESPFEVVVGALLVQNTAWTNASRAVERLKQERLLHPRALQRARLTKLARLVRVAGFHNVKSRRLKTLAAWVVGQGGMDALALRSTAVLREQLLALPGIGPETADAILLYAFDRRVFVADAYARRVINRLSGNGPPPTPASYDWYKAHVEAESALTVADCNELHALLVAHAKARCRNTPLCHACELAAGCRFTGSRRSAR
jgi:endonuclease-3 related protein